MQKGWSGRMWSDVWLLPSLKSDWKYLGFFEGVLLQINWLASISDVRNLWIIAPMLQHHQLPLDKGTLWGIKRDLPLNFVTSSGC